MNVSLKISNSDLTREKLLAISEFTEKTKAKIQNSDILLVPKMQVRDSSHRCFSAPTSDFYKLMKSDMSQYNIGLCENEGEEKTLTLHCIEIWIPDILVSIDPVKDVMLPALVSFIVNYISYKYFQSKDTDEPDVHLKIYVENKKTKVTKSLEYNGKYSGLKALKINAKDIFKE